METIDFTDSGGAEPHSPPSPNAPLASAYKYDNYAKYASTGQILNVCKQFNIIVKAI